MNEKELILVLFISHLSVSRSFKEIHIYVINRSISDLVIHYFQIDTPFTYAI